MSNLCAITSNQAAIIAFARTMRDITSNMPPLPGIPSGYGVPIVGNTPERRELALVLRRLFPALCHGQSSGIPAPGCGRQGQWLLAGEPSPPEGSVAVAGAGLGQPCRHQCRQRRRVASPPAQQLQPPQHFRAAER